ncbi:MAG TPA: hypothetical protein VLF93_04070 [Candidatus Saccharimonadales bacterium]|nr:hypothetical protein [Candidatus Saccharimonadales bacterium]
MGALGVLCAIFLVTGYFLVNHIHVSVTAGQQPVATSSPSPTTSTPAPASSTPSSAASTPNPATSTPAPAPTNNVTFNITGNVPTLHTQTNECNVLGAFANTKPWNWSQEEGRHYTWISHNYYGTVTVPDNWLVIDVGSGRIYMSGQTVLLRNTDVATCYAAPKSTAISVNTSGSSTTTDTYPVPAACNISSAFPSMNSWNWGRDKQQELLWSAKYVTKSVTVPNGWLVQDIESERIYTPGQTVLMRSGNKAICTA